MKEVNEKHEREMRDQKEQYESQISKLKNSINALQIDLDLERNQMNANEEMIHSMIHNIYLGFA